jgi:hypothetical protein
MILSRKLAAMFFCVFVLGAVAGALIVYNMGGMRFSDFLNRTSDPAGFAQRLDHKLAEQYHLDDDEQKKIAPFTREMAQKLFQDRREFATRVLATLDASHADIAARMSPDHRDAYIKDNLGRRQRAESMLMATTNAPGAARQQ